MIQCSRYPCFFFLNFSINLLLVALALHCSMWAFSSCGKQELFSSCAAKASHYGGFSYCGAQALSMQASAAVVCDSRARGLHYL